MSKRRDPNDRAWADFSEAFRTDGLPKILGSSVTLSVLGGGRDLDPKQCIELGAILLADKPLILVVQPGATIPSRLRRAADLVIEDWTPDNHDAQERLTAAITTLAGEIDD
jgi:hypothetical protein